MIASVEVDCLLVIGKAVDLRESSPDLGDDVPLTRHPAFYRSSPDLGDDVPLTRHPAFYRRPWCRPGHVDGGTSLGPLPAGRGFPLNADGISVE
jgi:hypothetical protein